MPKQKKNAANGYKRAESFPGGEILEDVAKKKWKLGPSIGQGGFGDIYSAQEVGIGGSKFPYVIKIEPSENGPLFVEMHFYIKFAKQAEVEEYKAEKRLKTFGMPLYIGSGSHEYNGEKYRFIVMEKFGTDLWEIFLQHNKHFPTTTVFKIAIQIIDILEYIHNKGYVHADIKGANILMGITKETQNKQVYLTDFGLATKCYQDDQFKPNPKKAHDGTIEYLSRDAHNGVQTKRGDLETLAYNLVQWLGCVLPWENTLKDPKSVQKLKEEYMSSVFKFIKACFDKRSPPGPIVDFLNYISSLNHNSDPDYKQIRKIFLSGLDPGDAIGKPFQFTVPERSPVKRKNLEKPKSSPKKKQSKKEAEEDNGEFEKENLDEDLIETDDFSNGIASSSITSKRKKISNRKTAQKTISKTKDLRDQKYMDMEKNEDEHDIQPNIEAVSTNTNEVAEAENINKKKKINKKKAQNKNSKLLPQHEEKEENSSGNDDMENADKELSKESISANSSNGRKKTESKKKVGEKIFEEYNSIEENKPEPEVSVRTRARGRLVNYEEYSDEEIKPSRKKTKKPSTSKEVHVTGDSSDGQLTTKKNLVEKPKAAKTKKDKETLNVLPLNKRVKKRTGKPEENT